MRIYSYIYYLFITSVQSSTFSGFSVLDHFVISLCSDPTLSQHLSICGSNYIRRLKRSSFSLDPSSYKKPTENYNNDDYEASTEFNYLPVQVQSKPNASIIITGGQLDLSKSSVQNHLLSKLDQLDLTQVLTSLSLQILKSTVGEKSDSFLDSGLNSLMSSTTVTPATSSTIHQNLKSKRLSLKNSTKQYPMQYHEHIYQMQKIN